MAHRTLTPAQYLLQTIEDDTEESPWIMMGDPQMRATSSLYHALAYYFRQNRPGWYVASMLPLRFRRPDGRPGQLGPDLFVAQAADWPRQPYDLMSGEAPPSFVLEVLSPASVTRDVELKRGAYEALGVREYALFAPTSDLRQPGLQGFRRDPETAEFVPWELVEETPSGEPGLWSEVLGLWLVTQGPELRAQLPDGTRLLTYAEQAETRQRLEAEIARLREELRRRDV